MLFLIIAVNEFNQTPPGFFCTDDSQCSTKFCCHNFCSACCKDSDCPDQDICIIQRELHPVVNYRTCFYGRALPVDAVCWLDAMCESNLCQGGIQFAWNIVEGNCVSSIIENGKYKSISKNFIFLNYAYHSILKVGLNRKHV